MKTLGIIGGISYHSTAVYYSAINQLVNEKLGGHHAAKLLLYSVNYNDFKMLQSKNDWSGIEAMLSEIALRLESAGAECILLSCNTAHLIAGDLRKKLKVPFIHIVEETAHEIAKHNMKKVGLLGTTFTMENPFFADCLAESGIETILPNTAARALIHATILDELSQGYLSAKSKSLFQTVIGDLKARGAEAVVFGCTEIGMFIEQEDSELKIMDTTTIHIKSAVDFAISDEAVE
ncbi:MAG: aspartate/glutamate racemase family protein [Flavobacteriales bacterium]